MQAYPEECCGVIVGRSDRDVKTVCDVFEIKNAKGENRERRFLITPDEYRRAENQARSQGLDILGFYHSHPDHPARPSQFDLEHALPVLSSIIVTVENGLSADVRSWVLRDDRSGYTEEVVEVLDGEFKHITC